MLYNLDIHLSYIHSPLSNSIISRKPPSPRFLLHQVRVIRSSNQIQKIGRTLMAQISSTHVGPNSVNLQQKVIVSNNYGEKLVGILHETGSKEIAVLCHGFKSMKDEKTMVNLAVAFENTGMSAFRFDFAGNGESEGSFQYGNYRREAEDLRAVVQHFCEKKRVITAILGHSKGGNAVLLYASKYHDINTVINISGRFNLKEGIEERLGKDVMQKVKEDGFVDVRNNEGEVIFRVTEDSMMDRLNTDMREACLAIDKKCRVLTIHGSADQITPVGDALEFAKVIPNHELQIIEGADHGYTSHQPELASFILAFVTAGLKKENHSP